MHSSCNAGCIQKCVDSSLVQTAVMCIFAKTGGTTTLINSTSSTSPKSNGGVIKWGWSCGAMFGCLPHKITNLGHSSAAVPELDVREHDEIRFFFTKIDVLQSN